VKGLEVIDAITPTQLGFEFNRPRWPPVEAKSDKHVPNMDSVPGDPLELIAVEKALVEV
jgi:hypothetical protein